mmetsp:Transcript_1747/g.2826  ORF Transcript_1747/g.2826 Transcript_1747/m.2826 type:complete len:451 (-) Transcript_1747:336-1688(-)
MQVTGFQNRWKVKYDLLVEYKQEHGHCHIPTKEIIDGHKLGSWADNQRGFYKKGTLLHGRVHRLNGIGFNWSPMTTKAYQKSKVKEPALRAQSMKVGAFQQRWNEKYDLLVEYKQEHGHCNVPRNDITNGQKFSSWLNIQRRFYKKGTLPGHRVDRLNEIGFNWSVYDVMGRTMCVRVSWEEQFKQLVKFKGKHGHYDVPQHDMINSQKLGLWVREQRASYKNGTLLNYRLVRLNEIRFNWSGSYLSWEGRFKQLVEFKGEHGHCHVHLRYLDNPPLGQWLDQQRKRYRGKKLQKDRIDQLNGIDGFTWEARRRGPRAHVGSEDVEQSEADERKNAPVNGEGTLIEGTEAPTAKSTTRRTNETNDEREPPEISDSQAVRAKRATKRNASSCNTKEDLQAHWRGKKAKRSAIPESGAESNLTTAAETTTAKPQRLSTITNRSHRLCRGPNF